MPLKSAALEVRIAQPAEQREACELVFSELASEQRAAQVAQLLESATAEADLDGLLVAVRSGRIVGATWANMQPGRIAYVWAAQICEKEAEDTADRLLAAAVDFCARRNARLAQTLVESERQIARLRFERAGFCLLTELMYLMSFEKDPSAQAVSADLSFEPYTEASLGRLQEVLERTYERTLDSPELNGVRDVGEILAGYRAIGRFDPKHWLIATHAGRDIGCVLLAEHPSEHTFELVYMGLVPDVRGRGWGLEVVRKSQQLAQSRQSARLVLAVDARNEFALHTYFAAGFVVWDRRSVLARIFEQ